MELQRVLDFRGASILGVAAKVRARGRLLWRRHLGLPVLQSLHPLTTITVAVTHGCRVSPLDAAGEPTSPGAPGCTEVKHKACDDGDPCTIDRCVGASGCGHKALPAGTVCGLDPVRACSKSGACAALAP